MNKTLRASMGRCLRLRGTKMRLKSLSGALRSPQPICKYVRIQKGIRIQNFKVHTLSRPSLPAPIVV
jgi:hypothetical protein